MSDGRLIRALALTWLCSVLSALILFNLIQPRYVYSKLESAPIRVEVRTGEVELLDMKSGKWVTWAAARRMIENR